MTTRTEELANAARALGAEGLSQREIADRLGVSRVRITQVLAAKKPETPPAPALGNESERLEGLKAQLLHIAEQSSASVLDLPLNSRKWPMISTAIAIDKYILLASQTSSEKELSVIGAWLAALTKESDGE